MKGLGNYFYFVLMAAMMGSGLVPSVPAATIYTTFGPNGSFDTNNIVTLGGSPGGIPLDNVYAVNFVSPVTATVGSATVALTFDLFLPLIPGSPGATVTIHSNTATGPGGIVGGFSTETSTSSPGIFTFTSTTGIQLVAGTEYWFAVNADGAGLFLNDQGIDTLTATRSEGKWTETGVNPATAFELDSVPEPGTPALGGMMLMALCVWRWRGKSLNQG